MVVSIEKGEIARMLAMHSESVGYKPAFAEAIDRRALECNLEA
jgi:hypothetical protein